MFFAKHLRHTPYWEIYFIGGEKKGNKSIAIKIVPEVDLDKELVYCLFG